MMTHATSKIKLRPPRSGSRIKGVFMPDSIQSLLNAFPEGVVHVRAGLVLAANDKARQHLPQLTLGEPLPVDLRFPEQGETEKGAFVSGGVSYTYSCKTGGEDHILLFRPDARIGLEGWQLDGALRQLRELLGDVLAEAGSAVPNGETSAAFNKTFHRLFRLIGNLEFMQQLTEEGGVPFHPTTVDLDGLCRETVRLAGDLLREAGVALEYICRTQRLLISGDAQLLNKMLLGLISNAARAAEKVTVTLRRRGDQALIAVSDGGPVPDRQQLNVLLQGGPGEGIPLPGQGAGLGLPIARHIVRLHGGTLLPSGGKSASGVLVSLPAGSQETRVLVRTPPVQRDGGLDPVLVELSDVLPASVFGLEGLD